MSAPDIYQTPSGRLVVVTGSDMLRAHVGHVLGRDPGPPLPAAVVEELNAVLQETVDYAAFERVLAAGMATGKSMLVAQRVMYDMLDAAGWMDALRRDARRRWRAAQARHKARKRARQNRKERARRAARR